MWTRACVYVMNYSLKICPFSAYYSRIIHILSFAYYSKNYSGIIGTGLSTTLFVSGIPAANYYSMHAAHSIRLYGTASLILRAGSPATHTPPPPPPAPPLEDSELSAHSLHIYILGTVFRLSSLHGLSSFSRMVYMTASEEMLLLQLSI